MNFKTTEYSNSQSKRKGSAVLTLITIATIVACFVQLARVL